MKISATTVMLPQYDMGETAALLSRLGYDGAEWRIRWIPEGERGKPYSPWGNVKNDYTPQMFADHPEKLVEISKRYNLANAGIASGVSANNLKEIELLSKGAASAKAPFIRIDSRDYSYMVNYNTFFSEAIDDFKKALEVTKSYGVRVLIEMHNRTIYMSGGLAYRFVSRFDPSELGVIYDLANIVQEGYEDSKMAVELLGPYIGHVHLGGRAPKQGDRQSDGTVNWRWEGTSLAEGLLNVKKAISDLKSIGYDKFISVEDFRQSPPVEVILKENLTYIRSAILQA